MIELAAKLSAGRYLAAYLGQVSGQPEQRPEVGA